MAHLVTRRRALSREWLDEPFEKHRDKRYTRELLFSMVVDLVALGLKHRLLAPTLCQYAHSLRGVTLMV